jgi:hypothetical protein
MDALPNTACVLIFLTSENKLYYVVPATFELNAPAYAEGLISLYEKRCDEALKKAKEAYAKFRWSHKAKILE